jgi:hypothetical protein
VQFIAEASAWRYSQGWVQFIAETSAEPVCGAWTATERVNGSSCWAAFERPADSRRQEITPNVVRLSIFIAQKIPSLSFGSRILKAPYSMPTITPFSVVDDLPAQKRSAFVQNMCDADS